MPRCARDAGQHHGHVAYARAVELLRSSDLLQQRRGIGMLQVLAKLGSTSAMHRLGQYFDARKSWGSALRWFRLAAALQHQPSAYKAAIMQIAGRGCGRDEAAGIAVLERLALHGAYAPAQAYLGVFYRTSRTKACPTLAAYYLEAAASAGCIRGIIGLGDCYKAGTGVQRDWAKAAELYRDAIARGSTFAMYSLGALLLQQKVYAPSAEAASAETEGVQWVQRAAERGHAEAMYHYALLLQQGHAGVARDVRAAIAWFRRAADADHGKSCFQLGKLYETGLPPQVAANQHLMLHYYRRGVALGWAPCMNSLGLCYASSKGVVPDMVRARRYYAMAAARGDIHGKANLAVCLRHGLGGHVDGRAAVRLLQEAAAQGHTRAMVRLGNWLLEGQSQGDGSCGEGADLDRALAYFRDAAARGDVYGRYRYAVTILNKAPEDVAVLEEAVQLLKQQPQHKPSQVALGKAYLQMGRMDDALAAWRSVGMDVRITSGMPLPGGSSDSADKWLVLSVAPHAMSPAPTPGTPQSSCHDTASFEKAAASGKRKAPEEQQEPSTKRQRVPAAKAVM